VAAINGALANLHKRPRRCVGAGRASETSETGASRQPAQPLAGGRG
jgi:hypothetical protein